MTPLQSKPGVRRRAMIAALDTVDSLAGMLPFRRRAPVEDARIKRIVVMELWNIGDVVLALPFLHALRRRFPQAFITLVARPFASELLGPERVVDEFIAAHLDWNAPGDRRSVRYYAAEFRRVLRAIRRRNFDLGFVARGHIRDHVLLGLSGTKRRVGYGLGYHRALLTDVLGADSLDQHKAKTWLGLLGPFGAPDSPGSPLLSVTPEELSWADSYLESHGVLPGERLVGIHAGASTPAKRWPMDRFAAVAAELTTRPGVRVLAFVAPAGDGAAVANVPSVIPAKVGLRQMAALLVRCEFLVCNDSGPMHIAGVVGTPTVAVFGARVARWFAPLGEGHTIITPGKDIPNLSAIPTSEVQLAVERCLAPPPENRAKY